MKRTTAFATLALSALTVAVVPSVADAAADTKDACKKGEYAQYVNPATSAPFADQGSCVSFVNQGGTLVKVGGAIPPSDPGTATHPDIAFSEPELYTWTGLPPSYIFTVNLAGYPADTVVEVSETSIAGDSDYLVMTQADGSRDLGRHNPQCADGPFTVTTRWLGGAYSETLPVPSFCSTP